MTISPQAHLATPLQLRDLPSLPLELQLSILTHLPANQLFPLRRVSRDWNNMLRNPCLLDAINDNLPYLTSARDLSTRLKRRMRMTRGEPVWAKPFHEAFPWACRGKIESDSHRWIRYWHGWIVMLTHPSHNAHERPPEVKLRMGHLARGTGTGAVMEVDVLQVLKEKEPEVYKEFMEDYILSRSGSVFNATAAIQQSHLYVEAGKVVVGLRVTKRQSPGTNGSLASSQPEFLIFGEYLFIFSLTTGELIQYIHTHPPPNTYNVLILTRLNDTHLLTVNYAETLDPTPRPSASIIGNTPPHMQGIPIPISLQPQTTRYIIKTYPLNANLGAPGPEIVISDPSALSNGRVGVPAYLAVWMRTVVFDELGRVWFPYLPSASAAMEVISEEEEQGRTEAQGRTPVKSHCKIRVMAMHEVPRSTCGNWNIFSAVEGLPQQPPPAGRPINDPRLQVSSGWNSTVFGKYHGALCMIYFNPIPPSGTPPLSGTSHVRAQATGVDHISRAAMSTGTISFHRFQARQYTSNSAGKSASPMSTLRITLPVSLALGRETYSWRSQPWFDEGAGQTLNEQTSVAWGYIGMGANGSLADPTSIEEFMRNVYLLPFQNDEEGEGGVDIENTSGAAWKGVGSGTCQRVSNGLPGNFWDSPLGNRGPREVGPMSGITMSRVWGDDGLVCWQGGVVGMGQVDRFLWVVCYEEEWAA